MERRDQLTRVERYMRVCEELIEKQIARNHRDLALYHYYSLAGAINIAADLDLVSDPDAARIRLDEIFERILRETTARQLNHEESIPREENACKSRKEVETNGS